MDNKNVEYAKAPSSATGNTGAVGSDCNNIDKSKKSEPVPNGEEVRIFHVWWTI